MSPKDLDDDWLVGETFATQTRMRTTMTTVHDGERRLANLVGQLNEVVTILKPDGTWEYSSEAGTRILGYPKGQDIEGGIFTLLHPDDVELAWSSLAEVLDGTRRVDQPVDLRVRDAAGTYHVFETVGMNLVDHPVINGVVLTARDVTMERYAAERARETMSTLRALVASLRDGVLFVDDDERIVMSNQAVHDLFELPMTPDELAGQTTLAIRDHCSVLVDGARDLGSRTDERYSEWTPVWGEELRLRNGRILELDYVPVRLEGDRRGHLFVIRDATEQRLREQQRNEMLVRERELRAATEEQNRGLLAVADMKAQFIADVSHELKTPLSSIVGFTELLLAGQSAEKQTEFAQAIDRNARRLQGVVDDLLMTEKLGSGRVVLRPTDAEPRELIALAVGALQPQADASQVELTIEDTTTRSVQVDPGRIDQLLVNLVSNAIKFTPQAGRVVVRSTTTPTAWSIEVSDTGIGIPALEQDRLFERFYRGSNARGKIAGTGLGLVICRSIVELHSGSISVTSSEGAGTTIRVELPIKYDDAS